MSLMLSQSPSAQSTRRRLSVGAAKTRICVHCGRSFRRTEHLERHVRTHTKEKPYTCLCGAAFSRRDLLKRHMGITGHQDSNPPNARSLVSSKSQSDHQDVSKQQQHARRASTHSRPHNAPPDPSPQDIAMTPSPDIAQWTMQQNAYLVQSHGMLDATANAPITHDAEVLEAAQLLVPSSLPVSYPDTQPPPPTMSYLPEVSNHFQDFTHFLDSIGLPLEWVPAGSEAHSAIPTEIPEEHSGSSFRRDPMERSRADSPFRSWLPSVHPGDQSLGMVSDYEPPPNTKKALPLKVTEEETVRLAASLEEFRHLIPDFVLPSRHTLTRYLTSFFEGFYPHLSFIHIPTLQIGERAPELILAFLTVGAQYRFEHRNAERLFRAAKAIVLYRLPKGGSSPTAAYSTATQIPLDTVRELSQSAGQGSPLMLSAQLAAGVSVWRQIEAIRTLLVLMGYATWERAELVQEALVLQGLLVRSLREFGLTENFSVTTSRPRPHHPSALRHRWRVWAEEESIRRTLFIAFCYLHIHSIAYNIYPVLRSSEIYLRLPCSTKEWHATTVEEWESAQQETITQQLFFQDALSCLLQPSSSSSSSTTTAVLEPIPSPVGNYILLHGLLQRIHLVNEVSLSEDENTEGQLPTEEIHRLEKALRSWTTVWQQAPESSLDPGNENGPIPFTSSSLLGLAFVRLTLNLGPHRHLETRDAHTIASALHRAPAPRLSNYLTPALIYSAHALSIPVRLGIDHIARSQAFFWSVQHSVASLDCAVLLSKWLVGFEGGTLNENENRILYWTRCIVQEAYSSLDVDGDNDDLSAKSEDMDTRNLGRAVTKLWARLFRKNTQWPFINVLGESLEIYSDMI